MKKLQCVYSEYNCKCIQSVCLTFAISLWHYCPADYVRGSGNVLDLVSCLLVTLVVKQLGL